MRIIVLSFLYFILSFSMLLAQNKDVYTITITENKDSNDLNLKPILIEGAMPSGIRLKGDVDNLSTQIKSVWTKDSSSFILFVKCRGYEELKLKINSVQEPYVSNWIEIKSVVSTLNKHPKRLYARIIKRASFSRNNFFESWSVEAAKPAIYLYSETAMRVVLKHDYQGTVLNTYPDYGNGWDVITNSDGKILNSVDNRNYSYLFWDGECDLPFSYFDYKAGFYVDKKDYVSFLLDKLTQLSFNETEINDFIVYWLPELSKHEHSFIYFRINDDIGNTSKLDVTPIPDTTIRVFMDYSACDVNAKKLPEQKLPILTRKGFTLLEWGGGEVNPNAPKVFMK